MTRVIALISWYDEHPGWLTELVGSLAAAAVDHVVAVDGAYALYPQAKGWSPSEQGHAVVAACAGAGIGCTLHAPSGPWMGNEVEKRDRMFALAHVIAKPGRDWLWVIDADELVTDAPGLTEALDETDRDVAEVLLWRDEPTGERSNCPARRLFRAHPGGIRVVGNHFTYIDGGGRKVCGYPTGLESAAELWDVRVRHRASERLGQRVQDRDRYNAVRNDVGAESDAVPA